MSKPSSDAPTRSMLSGEDYIYPLVTEQNDIEQRYNSVVGPLQLFAPYPHEDEPPHNDVVLERPVTPINDEIKSAPQQLQRLARLIRRRVTPRPNDQNLSMEDQKELAAIIMGEVNGVWTDIRTQVDHPFFRPEENAELQRRIAVHVVTVCEQLFNHYIDKAETLQKRGVFSGPANMSRLKAQLALDANKYLNILTIRRYIVSDLQRGDSDGEDEEYLPATAPTQQSARTHLSNKAFLDASRPKSKAKKRYYVTAKQAIDQLQASMPGLDTSKLVTILSEMTLDPKSPLLSSTASSEKSRKSPMEVVADFLDATPPKLKRSGSAPRLNIGETLMEELGIEKCMKQQSATLDHVNLPLSNDESEVIEDHAQLASEDLRRLVGTRDKEEDEDEDDMPPLLQALTRSAKHDNTKEIIDQKLKELEERERQRIEEESVHIQDARYPQPSTVMTKLPNKMLAKTSDIRVSERICMSSMTLDKHATVYNDLIDEIDPATVKKLDSNLFLGDEITEVYKEIMKTVPTNHLDLEDDDLIEASADSVDLSAALASSTLHRPKRERIINPNLQRDVHTPWGEQEPHLWARTPSDPPLDIRGRPLVQPMTPRGEDKGLKDFLGKEAPKYVDDAQNMTKLKDMGEVMARSYASWLQWWKNTINSDDYIKYLSTQESDYMGVVFHFYNSDGDDDDEDGEMSTAKISKRTQKQSEERAQKKEEMMTIKTEFTEGFWNANSVLMGGLGQEPELEDEMTTASMAEKSDLHTDRSVARSRPVRVGRKTKTTDTLTGSDTGLASTKAGTPVTANTKKSKTDTKAELTAQDRLEQVWTQLQMPDAQKLDMAIKYSSDNYHSKLDNAIESWEKATDLILQREQQLAKLEKFERLASDPNRFFEKGTRGSSVARLHEAKIRTHIQKKMESIENDLAKVLKHIERDFDDQVSFQGRPYATKMRVDRTEMLYWLQEERKQQALEYEMALRRNNQVIRTDLSIATPVL